MSIEMSEAERNTFLSIGVNKVLADYVKSNEVFVFGSNAAGVHGAGSAREAVKYWGAVMGCGFGLQGGFGERGASYAIATKMADIRTPMPLPMIKSQVGGLLEFARANPTLKFMTVRVGCGLAGYDWERDVKPMFEGAPENVVFIEDEATKG